MAVISIKELKVKDVLVTNPDQLLELVDKIAVGLKDAILEFFVEKGKLPVDAVDAIKNSRKEFDDVEGPDEELEAGMDNEYFEDSGDPV